MSSSEKTKTHTHRRIIDGHHREDFSISIIINNNSRKNRENATLVVSTTVYIYEFDPFEFKRRENLSPFLVGGILRERQNSNPRRRTRVRTLSLSLSLSLSPSVPKPMENALESVYFESAKKRPLKEHTKGMHHRSSRLKRKKKSNELFKNTRTTSVVLPSSRRSAIDVDPSVAMGIGTSADGSSSLSLLAAVRKLVAGGCVVAWPGAGAGTPMIR